MLREYKDFFNKEASLTFLNLALIPNKMALTERIIEIGESILEADAELQTPREQNDKKAILDLTGRFSDHCADYFKLSRIDLRFPAASSSLIKPLSKRVLTVRNLLSIDVLPDSPLRDFDSGTFVMIVDGFG